LLKPPPIGFDPRTPGLSLQPLSAAHSKTTRLLVNVTYGNYIYTPKMSQTPQPSIHPKHIFTFPYILDC
jgi:hypothetical protein